MVLEAWENAEVVGYSLIGEEEKTPSNVIDYAIRDEQTIDQNLIDNASSQTTTGLATVIPGVNAPKLIESTSIYNNTTNETGAATIYSSMSEIVDQGVTYEGYMPLTKTAQEGPYDFEIGPSRILTLPATGVYLIKCTYKCTVNAFHREYDIYINSDSVYHLQDDSYYSQYRDAYPTEEFYINGKSGDQFSIKYKMYITSGGTGNSMDWNITAVLRKI